MPDPNRWLPIQQLLYWPDDVSLDIIFATAMHTKFPGDPIWLLLIGPSASGKTAIIDTLSGHYLCKPLDEISSKGFVTGSNNQVEFLRTLDGNILLVKELTVMLNQSKETADQVFAQLRAIYDGSFTKATGLGMKSISARFGFLAGCVPDIDTYAKLNASMGDRFLRVEWPVNRDELVKAARRNSGSDAEVRLALQEFAHGLLDRSVDMLDESWAPYARAALPRPFEDLIDEMAKLMGLLRAQVMRDHFHKVISMPVADGGARLAKLLTELTRSLLFLYEDPVPGYEVVEALRRVCYSMINRQRRAILAHLLEAEQATTMQIADAIRVSHQTVREEVEDCWMAKLVDTERMSDRSVHRLRPEIRELLATTGIYLKLENPGESAPEMAAAIADAPW